MKIIIPSYLPDDATRNSRLSNHYKQLRTLEEFGLLNSVIIGTNNYTKNEYYYNLPKENIIHVEKGLQNALGSLIKYVTSKFQDENILVMDDDILPNSALFKVINYIIDNHEFDIVSLHEFNSPYSNNLTFIETFILCNSLMLIKNRSYPDFSIIESNDNPCIEFGIECQLLGMKTFRIKGSDFVENLGDTDSTLHGTFEERTESSNQLMEQLHQKYIITRGKSSICENTSFGINLDQLT